MDGVFDLSMKVTIDTCILCSSFFALCTLRNASLQVSTNGYISMGLTPTANAQSVAGANSIIAPYGADIDTQVAGSVKYTHFYSDYSDLDDVSDFIEDEMNVDFNGEKMMVAEWNNVAEYNGDPVSYDNKLN